MNDNKYDITEIKRKYHNLFVEIAKKRMEDYLLTIIAELVDSSTGEVLYKSTSSKPLSLLSEVDYCKYIDSFIRGIRQGKDVAITLSICKDRDIQTSPKQLEIF